jgi:hypothetical protein
MASAAIFIADPQQSQGRVQHENLALRDGIDRTSTCDEIVGSSGALQKVLSHVSKLLPRTPPFWSRAKPGQARNLLRARFIGGRGAPHALL